MTVGGAPFGPKMNQTILCFLSSQCQRSSLGGHFHRLLCEGTSSGVCGNQNKSDENMKLTCVTLQDNIEKERTHGFVLSHREECS